MASALGELASRNAREPAFSVASPCASVRGVLNPDEPSWMALRHGLDALVNTVDGATLAAVIDDTPVLVCWSTPRSPMVDRWAPVAQLCDEVCAREMPRLARPLRRGGHISAVRGGSPVGVVRKGHPRRVAGWRSSNALHRRVTPRACMCWSSGSMPDPTLKNSGTRWSSRRCQRSQSWSRRFRHPTARRRPRARAVSSVVGDGATLECVRRRLGRRRGTDEVGAFRAGGIVLRGRCGARGRF